MENILTYIRKGFEYKNNGSYKQAIEMFYKALELENNNVEILFQLGELYFLLDNMERAEHYFKQVLVI
ncbi:tetratricopeptide repeat protein, partial [bacterium]|nr:tetratricopeptide repeat protein [bacterium]